MHSSKIQTVRDKPLKLPLKMIVLTHSERISGLKISRGLRKKVEFLLLSPYRPKIEIQKSRFNIAKTLFDLSILSLLAKTIILRGNLMGLSRAVWILENCIFNVKSTVFAP